jgi:hypothetical protein
MDGQPPSDGRHLVWLWKPTGYELREETGPPPAIGSEVSDGELRLRVTKIGPSPLPGDSRPCAYTIAVR